MRPHKGLRRLSNCPSGTSRISSSARMRSLRTTRASLKPSFVIGSSARLPSDAIRNCRECPRLKWSPRRSSALSLLGETRDPPGPLASNGTYDVTPPGTRPYYCLESVAQQRSPKAILPAGFDYCETPIARQILKARDTGQSLYIPYKIGKTETLALGRATYANGTVPSTLEGRRAGFVGLTGIVVVPRVLLSTALAGHPNTAVSFRYADGTSTANFTAGSAASGTQTVTNNLHNGWTVATLGSVESGGLFSNPNTRATLLAGIALSLLLGALVLVLGTGRARAGKAGTTNCRTSVSRPPRSIDDAAQPSADRGPDRTDAGSVSADRPSVCRDVSRSRRLQGHQRHSRPPVGDQVLTAVALRLKVRYETATPSGRQGGDEFILLVEDAALSVGRGGGGADSRCSSAPIRLTRTSAPHCGQGEYWRGGRRTGHAR